MAIATLLTTTASSPYRARVFSSSRPPPLPPPGPETTKAPFAERDLLAVAGAGVGPAAFRTPRPTVNGPAARSAHGSCPPGPLERPPTRTTVKRPSTGRRATTVPARSARQQRRRRSQAPPNRTSPSGAPPETATARSSAVHPTCPTCTTKGQSVIETRVICDAVDTDHVVAALDDAFKAGTITILPTRVGKQNRLYPYADHEQAPEENAAEWARYEAYAIAPDVKALRKLGDTLS